MARPKGSKNKKSLIVDYAAQLEQKISAKSAIEEESKSIQIEIEKLKSRAKEVKKAGTKLNREIAKLVEMKAVADAEKEKVEKTKQLDEKIATLLGDGKSMDEIISALNNV